MSGTSRSSRSASAESGGASTSRDRKPEGPRRVRNGIKLRLREGVPTGELADVWVRRVEESVRAEELTEGLRYARLGQTVTMEVEAGRVVGRVQGRAAQPYDVTLEVTPYDAEQWDRIVDAMAREAMYLVKLLDR